jgi:polar amino acid transport system substrate-binding protein
MMLFGVTGAAWAQDTGTNLASESVIEIIKERGALRIGLDFFVPWAMRAKNGELVGFEIDVATRVAEDMGVEIEFVPTAWDGIIPALLSGKFDVVIAGMSVTPERHLRINFTAPYATSGMMIAANSKTVPGLTRVSDFNNADITIGAKRGTTAVDAIQKNAPKARLRQYDEEVVGMQDAINGTIDAYFSSSPVPERAVASSEGRLYLPVQKTFDGTIESFAVRKGDPDAIVFFNNWILLRQQDGWLQERHDYWFVGDDWSDQVDVK